MKRMHNLLDTRCKIPIVDIEQIDVSRPQILERAFKGKMHRLDIVPGIHDLLRDGGVVQLRVVRVLVCMWRSEVNRDSKPPRQELTLVAMKSWSLIPFVSAHSPINSSERPSWLHDITSVPSFAKNLRETKPTKNSPYQ